MHAMPQYKILSSYNGELVLYRCVRVLEVAAIILPGSRLGMGCHSDFYPGGSQDLLSASLSGRFLHQPKTRLAVGVHHSLVRMVEHCTEMVRDT